MKYNDSFSYEKEIFLALLVRRTCRKPTNGEEKGNKNNC